MKTVIKPIHLSFLLLIVVGSCEIKRDRYQTDEQLKDLNLLRGDITLCGATEGQFGNVSFGLSCQEKVRYNFNLAIALLHSFEYEEAEKIFAKVIDEDRECAMAYWGVAMSNFHPLWAPPTPAELEKGEKAIELARLINKKTKRETDYIEAIAKFYKDPTRIDHRSRISNFEKAMEKIYLGYPDDKEASVFYALALNAAADPADKTYSNQKKAVGILSAIFQKEPLHPGIAHYIIHNYDYPELAELALPAARKYASIAPASAHAQHMPSHIFTRLGLWDEGIQSNLVAASSAKCYAEKEKIIGHWDEELHALDYLAYAYLQKGQDEAAAEQLEYLGTINEVYPLNFKTAYTFAALPARYFLEKRMWKDAAAMNLHPANFPWEKFPWQKSIFHFARLLGSVHTGDIDAAKTELEKLKSLHESLVEGKNNYKEVDQVAVQIKAGEAWLLFKQGKKALALELMISAAQVEDGFEKHPVTPGEVIPAKELLGDMYLEMGEPAKALEAYETNLKRRPNRFNGLYGAGVAAEKLGDVKKASEYYKQLLKIAHSTASKRPEFKAAESFVKNHSSKIPGV